jgi:hypothetical protein
VGQIGRVIIVRVVKDKKDSKKNLKLMLTSLKPGICVVHVLQEPFKTLTIICLTAQPVNKASISWIVIQKD